MLVMSLFWEGISQPFSLRGGEKEREGDLASVQGQFVGTSAGQ